ncbi:hypothetical protein, partial [Tautonia marina]|uniref:hypothetical protein n=1 Tax=Tautonia marina TaxID=2653855 RepID=UPI00137576CA
LLGTSKQRRAVQTLDRRFRLDPADFLQSLEDSLMRSGFVLYVCIRKAVQARGQATLTDGPSETMIGRTRTTQALDWGFGRFSACCRQMGHRSRFDALSFGLGPLDSLSDWANRRSEKNP